MERYEKIISDYDEFLKSLKSPQPLSIRVNNHKSSLGEVKELLNERKVEFQGIKFLGNFLKVDSDLGKSLGHWLGKFYVQELTSGLPPVILNPEPEDKVIDMCASPGSKTTQISARMENKGLIHANDVRTNRIRALLSNLYRTGCVNVRVTQRDGRQIPEDEKFDKVLVDVPCSGESNLRGSGDLNEKPDLEKIESLSQLQKGLLDKALRLCKKGGTVVYSTCTFAPEENELVVSEFLDGAKLKRINPKFEHSRGITSWRGESFPEEMKKCIRVYPHHLDSGGVFVAKFEK